MQRRRPPLPHTRSLAACWGRRLRLRRCLLLRREFLCHRRRRRSRCRRIGRSGTGAEILTMKMPKSRFDGETGARDLVLRRQMQYLFGPPTAGCQFGPMQLMCGTSSCAFIQQNLTSCTRIAAQKAQQVLANYLSRATKEHALRK